MTITLILGLFSALLIVVSCCVLWTVNLVLSTVYRWLLAELLARLMWDAQVQAAPAHVLDPKQNWKARLVGDGCRGTLEKLHRVTQHISFVSTFRGSDDPSAEKPSRRKLSPPLQASPLGVTYTVPDNHATFASPILVEPFGAPVVDASAGK